MILYHGSNVAVKQVDLARCKPDKDFGRGFYLTDILQQAEQMALRRTRIMDAGTPVISRFEFDEALLAADDLNVKIFERPSEEWSLFVLRNRETSATGFKHGYDIVIGPVADDGVVYQLERYTHGIITLEKLTEELTFRNLNRQYYFGTKRAITKLLPV